MVLWNNVDLRKKGIIVESTPKIVKAKKRLKTYEIEGRNGVLVVDNNTYTTFSVSIECHFDFDKFTLTDIMAFLDGYGVLSLDGVTQYHAYIKNAIEFEKVMNFRKFVIQFECNPIAEDIESTIANITGTPATLDINATTNMHPIIDIVASGNVSITFNNKTFYLYELNGSYKLDCDAKEIVNSNNQNSSHLMKGDFPYLIGGENHISYTGTITQFKIEYKKSYI